jgi:SAM-dependent methyltransferase
MCQVFHHLDAPQDALQEIRRVLMPAGCLVIRNGTRENEAEIEWARCFPEAQQIDYERLPSQQEVVDLVPNQGFAIIAQQTISQYFASSYQEYYDKIAERGLSSLISISDAAFYAGLQRLKQWVAKQPPDKPVYEPVDLLVFRVVK